MATPSTRENAEHRRHSGDAPDVDAVVDRFRDSPGSTCSIGCAIWASPSASSRGEAGSAAPGTGTATPAPAAIPTASSIRTSSRTCCSRSGAGPSVSPRSRRSCAIWSMWRTVSTSAATSGSGRPLPKRPSTRRRDAGGSRPMTGPGSPPAIASWPPGASLPSTGRNSTAWTVSPASGTTPAPGPMRGSPSPANGSASLARDRLPSSRSR